MGNLILEFSLRKLNWGNLHGVPNICRKGMAKSVEFAHNVGNGLGDQ